MLNFKEFISAANKFNTDTKEWGGLDQHKHYTTHDNNIWIETPDNAHGGMDISWAFHLNNNKIDEFGVSEYESQKDDLIERLLEFVEVDEEQREAIKRELQDVDIMEDESIVINNTGTTGGADQELIYEVALSNGDMQRHICYI